ncbi:MAG: hypothetical protein PVJ27_06375 [Candidatus Brocadiaceae bacterium]
MSAEKKLRALEGIGYAAAIMIGVGCISEARVLEYFNVLGLAFAVIAIVRLMVMDIRIRQGAQIYGASEGRPAEVEEQDN